MDFAEYALGRQISYLSGFLRVILEKGNVKEKYQLQCPPPCDAVTHQMVKSSCSYYGCTAQTGRGRGARSLHPRVPQKPRGIASTGVCQTYCRWQQSCKLKPIQIFLAGARRSGGSRPHGAGVCPRAPRQHRAPTESSRSGALTAASGDYFLFLFSTWL